MNNIKFTILFSFDRYTVVYLFFRYPLNTIACEKYKIISLIYICF